MPIRLAELEGSRVGGTLQIAESALNDLLALMATGSRGVNVEVLRDNIILVRYGMVHARAQLPGHVVTGESPRLTVRLSSLLVAWGLKALVRQPFIEVHGQDLTIALAQVPALSEWRDSWRHVKQVTLGTQPGQLRVGFDVGVDSERSGLRRDADRRKEEQ